MAESDYSKLLKHPKWQRKRLEIMERDDFKCKMCGNEELTLHVHHYKYIRGRKPWEYDDIYFITLCEECHKHGNSISKFHMILLKWFFDIEL